MLARGASVALSPRVDGDSQVDYTRSVGVDLLDDGMATTNTDYMDLTDLENTATAGDVILMHPLLLHAPPTTNLGCTPRFLLNKAIYL